MYLATSAEMKFLDRLAIDRFGLPGIVLMENAARSIAQAALQYWPTWPERPTVAILGGPGQNGGDGWALARIFSSMGFNVLPYLVKGVGQEVRGDAAINLEVAKRMGLSIQEVTDDESPLPPWDGVDLVIDALFGTGLDRQLTGPADRLLQEALAAKGLLGDRLRVLAVDLPSGLSGDTGDIFGPPLPADLTVTLGLPKIGLYLKRGPELAGHIVVGDIGLTPQMIDLAPPLGRLSSLSEMKMHLPARPAQGHKGTFGHTLIVGGSRGMTGALSLAATGASRSGAALVTALYPASLESIYATKLTEVMTLDLPEDEPGEFSAAAGDVILEYGPGRQSLAMGPGLGLGDGARQMVRRVIEEVDIPLVLDADALTHLAGNLNLLKRCPKVVLTPHPAEAARLLSVTTADIQNDRLGAAREMAALSNAVVVLKGQNTIITAQDGHFYLNPTGGPHLAVGGSGDLLTGLLSGLLAQGMEPFNAAALAVWAHGRAGDLAREKLGPMGLTPPDFALNLPQVWRELRGS